LIRGAYQPGQNNQTKHSKKEVVRQVTGDEAVSLFGKTSNFDEKESQNAKPASPLLNFPENTAERA